MLNARIDTLTGGLTLVRVPMKSVESVTVLAMANTGSRFEKPAQYGIAHFLEHMVFKGTQKYPTAQDLAVAVDGIGAEFNAFTSKEYTGYYVQAASRHVSLAVDVISDMLLTPRLRQDDINREKGVIVEEINMYEDTPARHIGDIFEQMAFAGSGLEHDVIGSKETVTTFESKDFQNFLHQWYGLANMLVVVAGDAAVVDKPELLKEIDQAFQKGTEERNNVHANLEPFLSKSPFSSHKIHLEYKKTEQAHFVLGWPAFKRNDPRRYALTLLSVVMGGNMSSRLFTEVREKRGLCYYVHADVDHYHDTGMLEAAAGVDPKRVDEALNVTINEFVQLAAGQKPITQTELAAAKDFIDGKIALSLEDSQSVATFFGSKQLLLGEIETPEELLSKLRAVTLEEVNSLAEKIIKSGELRLALIGPFKNQSRFEKIITKIK